MAAFLESLPNMKRITTSPNDATALRALLKDKNKITVDLWDSKINLFYRLSVPPQIKWVSSVKREEQKEKMGNEQSRKPQNRR